MTFYPCSCSLLNTSKAEHFKSGQENSGSLSGIWLIICYLLLEQWRTWPRAWNTWPSPWSAWHPRAWGHLICHESCIICFRPGLPSSDLSRVNWHSWLEKHSIIWLWTLLADSSYCFLPLPVCSLLVSRLAITPGRLVNTGHSKRDCTGTLFQHQIKPPSEWSVKLKCSHH